MMDGSSEPERALHAAPVERNVSFLLLISVESEILPGAGEIEAFVAQRKIGDAVFTYGEGETLPVVK
jgi:hypothetical protein